MDILQPWTLALIVSVTAGLINYMATDTRKRRVYQARVSGWKRICVELRFFGLDVLSSVFVGMAIMFPWSVGHKYELHWTVICVACGSLASYMVVNGIRTGDVTQILSMYKKIRGIK